MWHAFEKERVDADRLISCFGKYLREDGLAVTRAQFEENLARKGLQPDFRDDVRVLLRPGLPWNIHRAMSTVLERLISKLPGEPWKGAVSQHTERLQTDSR